MEAEKVSLLRYRGSKLQHVKKLDLFPKVDEKCKEQTSFGGTLSIVSFALIFWLAYSEINYYLNSKFVFKFSPDIDFDAKLKLNVDITVAMPCSNLGADILDSTNQNTFKFGSLEEEDTWYELAPNQQKYFENRQHFNTYLREEYHSVQEFLWRSSHTSIFTNMPARNNKPLKPHDACRIYGSLILNKVAGNFHITAGKSLNLPRGHIHISAFMSDSDYNFTHRINKLSFGDPSPGIIHPLEGDEQVANSSSVLYQYFIDIVPTSVNTYLSTVETYQYSVKELSRPIDHGKGSHGMPGIFFKYDVSALKVTVRQERDNFGMFLARLCSIIAGIYICSSFINSFVLSLLRMCSKLTRSKELKQHVHIPDVVPVQTL
ncbi:hypothetical protein PPYR_12313 [Photinus pyralis]|uniref:Endoplasmic reticulum vesicle transporter C-terminal domain-containing protein n=1 Tax=Photinus pyralis TaxID=7054 RepID=A0A1Y1LZU7_PHOPY|nr:endoplasmic reticulum-Golgi intermediate compartment protein 2 [Photinus pyralis]XP_031349498.1 endoplasmic reticulum-Golgi intermediate compartment protein 2 [Photinus pyralis]KAB0795474.1 hypothetical protein PPYR_12313 [Photinus pyralis]